MTPGPHDVQELDFQILDPVEDDTITRTSRVEQGSWKLKLRGFGFRLEMERRKTTAEIGARNTMRGTDLREWRKRHRYNQYDLMKELGIQSRQTISTWENSNNELPRMLELALIALENVPDSQNIHGKRASAAERKRRKKLET